MAAGASKEDFFATGVDDAVGFDHHTLSWHTVVLALRSFWHLQGTATAKIHDEILYTYTAAGCYFNALAIMNAEDAWQHSRTIPRLIAANQQSLQSVRAVISKRTPDGCLVQLRIPSPGADTAVTVALLQLPAEDVRQIDLSALRLATTSVFFRLTKDDQELHDIKDVLDILTFCEGVSCPGRELTGTALRVAQGYANQQNSSIQQTICGSQNIRGAFVKDTGQVQGLDFQRLQQFFKAELKMVEAARGKTVTQLWLESWIASSITPAAVAARQEKVRPSLTCFTGFFFFFSFFLSFSSRFFRVCFNFYADVIHVNEPSCLRCTLSKASGSTKALSTLYRAAWLTFSSSGAAISARVAKEGGNERSLDVLQREAWIMASTTPAAVAAVKAKVIACLFYL